MSARRQWDELEELFNAAKELTLQDRETLFASHSLDADLRGEIDELLRAHDALEVKGEDAFLGSLDGDLASSLLDIANIDDYPVELLSAGETVGRYRIVRTIGRGGMGVIYLAVDSRLNRSVALKLLPPHLSVDNHAHRRFEEEARAASLLDHPNIATVYEVDDTADGRPFIAMAYYEGETLRDKLKRGQLAITDIVTLAIQIADGLKAAHAAGLVHRDIKPANIIVTPQGVAKIVDFGIARIATTEVTRNTATAGTVAYMSPEQTRGAPPDPRMDVWSLGVMLYEMLTGVRPFCSDRDEVVIFGIRNDEPVAIEQRREGVVPPGLIRIVEKCLRKDPVERYPDAGAIAADLKKLTDSGFDSTSPAPAEKPTAWRSPRNIVAAIALLVMVAAGAVFIRDSQRVTGKTATVPRSIAVLPFVDQPGTSEDAHFSAGLADELTTALGGMPGLKVAARPTFALYASGLDERAIADRLGVATLLEGSVQRDTARLKISARLVEARTHAVLWSKVYEVPVRDVFNVQHQIARSIASALNVRLTSTAADSSLTGRPTADLEAYDLYLRGRYLRTRPTRERLEQALSYFRGATERDPNFANAYSGLAETYVNLANFGYVSATGGFAYPTVAAERALELNPRLAEAYVSYAYVLTSRLMFDSAETAYRRGLELNPNFALGHHYYSLMLAMADRTDEALEQNRIARELDPLFAPAAADYGIILSQRGNLAGAGTALSRALPLEPNFALTLFWLGAVRAAEGSSAEATQLLEQARRGSPNYPGVMGALAYVYAHTGKRDAADSIVATLRARATDDRGRVNLAFAYASVGKRDEAFALLKRLNWDVASIIGLRADPLLRPLRSDPRYALLVRSITDYKKIAASTPP